MLKTTYFTLLTKVLYAGALFMLGECFYHFSGVRMMGITGWPTSALNFSWFFMSLWASASLLIALLLWYLARHAVLQKVLLVPLSYFAVFHGVLLWWWSLQPLTELWPSSAMYVWNPWYTTQLKIEAGLLFAFAGLVWWGKYRQKYL